MKKIFFAVAMVFSSMGSATLMAQDQDLALNNEKKELRQERKSIEKEEKTVRKEERSAARSEVTYLTKQEFRIDFPDAGNTSFRVGKRFEEVSYTLGGQPFTAYYDEDSKLVGTTTEKEFGDLPASAGRRITTNYIDKGYSVDRVLLFDDNEDNGSDMWLYGRSFDDEDVYFVELSRLGQKIILQVGTDGNVSYFGKL